jgi:hypothetical protein
MTFNAWILCFSVISLQELSKQMEPSKKYQVIVQNSRVVVKKIPYSYLVSAIKNMQQRCIVFFHTLHRENHLTVFYILFWLSNLFMALIEYCIIYMLKKYTINKTIYGLKYSKNHLLLLVYLDVFYLLFINLLFFSSMFVIKC